MINIRIVGAAIIISLVSFNPVWAWDFLPSYEPVGNNQPVKLLHISGRLSPETSIKIAIVYLTTNNSCKRITSSWLEGAFPPRSNTISIPVQKKNNTYNAIVPLDGLEEGYCKWLPFRIDLLVSGVDVPSAAIWIQTPEYKDASFAQDGINNPKEFNFICRGKTLCEPSPRSSHNITTATKEIKVNIITSAQQ